MPEETGLIEVTAKTQEGAEATVAYDFGANLDDAVDKYGAEVVFSLFRAQAKIQLQARMRAWMTAEPPKDVNAAAAMWKPGVVQDRTMDPLSVARNYLATLASSEDKAKFLEALKDVM